MKPRRRENQAELATSKLPPPRALHFFKVSLPRVDQSFPLLKFRLKVRQSGKERIPRLLIVPARNPQQSRLCRCCKLEAPWLKLMPPGRQLFLHLANLPRYQCDTKVHSAAVWLLGVLGVGKVGRLGLCLFR